jgi:anti-sigma factor RsiW
MDLTCDRVREVLWPLDRPRSHVPDEEAARAHLTSCPRCQTFFLRDAEIARLLRGVGEGLDVTSRSGLRLSIARALNDATRLEVAAGAEPHAIDLATARRPRFSGRRAELSVAAAVLLLLLGGQLLASRYGRGPDATRFAADFARTAAVDFDRPGLDVRKIGGFYERELGRTIVPVALHEAPVTRATVCDLRGQLGSMVEYDVGGTRMVHYRIPREADRTPTTGVTVESTLGVQVAQWMDGDFEHALVSSASAEHLEWLAENRFSRPPSVTNYGSPASRSWRPLAAGD